MMRKFNKKKGSRQGAILVTVVFILAFAMIFIAAAMMLTQSTRKRVYEEAESSQARLTVTSVAEAFYRSIQKCEFKDADLIELSKGPTTIHVEASATAGKIPGLEDEGVSSSASYTTVKLSRSPNGSGGTTDDDYTYYADFSTHIDGKVENVRAELSYVTPPDTIDTAPFNSQFDHNGVFTKNNMEDVGAGKADDPTNIFLVRKGANTDNSSFSSTATMVYCDGNITFKDEDFKSKDIVFLQGAKLKSGDSGKFKTGHVKNLFFFGSGTERISDDASRGNFGDCVSGLTFYLCGRTNYGNWTDGATVVEINSNGKKTNGDPVFSDSDKQKDFAKKVAIYYSYNTQYRAGGTNAFPTTDDFLSSIGNIANNKVTSKTAPSNPTWSGSLGDFLTSKSYQKNGGAYVSPGTYVFTSDGSHHDETHPGLSAKEPYIVVLEGGKKYQFWFKGDKNFQLYNVVFIVNDPKPAYPVLFILENKANVSWPGGSNGRVCGNGIFAVQGRSFNNAAKTYEFIHGEWEKNLDNPQKFENSGGSYSHRYNGSNEPCAMVIGMGHNTFEIDKNIIIESFIGLFNDSYGSKSNSTLSIRNNDHGVLYSRIMTDGYDDKDAGKWYMPATPGASSLPEPNPPFKKMVTGFSLNSMKYYYGIAPS